MVIHFTFPKSIIISHYITTNLLIFMQLISAGTFYMGVDDAKYCELNIHLGNLRIEYQCPNYENGSDQKQPDRPKD